MRRAKTGALAVATLLPVYSFAGPPLALIPPAYWGEFSPDPKFCGLPFYVDDDAPKIARSNNRIWVSADRVRGYAHARKVESVTKSPRGLILHFDLQMDEYPPPNHLELSKDGEVLNRHWRRCHLKRK